jgi:CII-binding regulator of phage lambda lysogenization HflD
MEIFGGFAVMVSILGFFLAVVWLTMPYMIITIKGKLDKTQDVLNGIEKRLENMEKQLSELHGEHRKELLRPTFHPSTSPDSDDRMPTT